MKKKLIGACLLAALFLFCPLGGGFLQNGGMEETGWRQSLLVQAEEGEESGGEDTEPETEHPAAYYEEIQTNEISGWPQGDAIDSDAAILMDGNTGAILYGKNIEKQEYPASITKIMTVLLALEYGNLDDVVTFSENAVYSIEYGSAHLGLTAGEELTLEQCLYGIMLASANEISNAVAEHIGGSIENFAQMMNDKAAELGCTNSHFVNANGLFDEDHYVCARDMALIMQAALKYDKFREIIGTYEYHYPATNLVDEERYFVNHHAMISDESMAYEGCLGGKTGYVEESWNTLVTAAERDGMLLISVVLRTPGIDSEYANTVTLLDYGFDNFQETDLENTTQAKINLEIYGITDSEEEAKIREADVTQEPFTMGTTTTVTVPKDLDTSALTATMDFSAGTLSYSYGGQTLGTTAFTYTGQWETETEAPTETETETQTETETETETEAAGFPGAVNRVMNVLSVLYARMDTFIKENTVLACVIGAGLLLIFIPMLLVAASRNKKYKRMMELRLQEMELRKRLEAEIERKSAAQIEAELRAQELEMELEEERRRHRKDGSDSSEETEEGEMQAAGNRENPEEEQPSETVEEQQPYPSETGEEPKSEEPHSSETFPSGSAENLNSEEMVSPRPAEDAEE